jgi:hypothetical protein
LHLSEKGSRTVTPSEVNRMVGPPSEKLDRFTGDDLSRDRTTFCEI